MSPPDDGYPSGYDNPTPPPTYPDEPHDCSGHPDCVALAADRLVHVRTKLDEAKARQDYADVEMLRASEALAFNELAAVIDKWRLLYSPSPKR